MSHNIRFHQKTRGGCTDCKRRHVKVIGFPLSDIHHELTVAQCNEGKPQCAGCSRRGVQCVYEPPKQRAKTPVRPNSPVAHEVTEPQPVPGPQHISEGSYYSAKSLLDLRLMHHYCIFTAEDFAASFGGVVTTSLKVEIPRWAMQHEFLMDSLLFVAMIHLCSEDPDSVQRLPVYLYRDQALRSLRQATANLSEETNQAVRGASVLLATVSFAADRVMKQSGLWVANWMALALGQRNFPGIRMRAGATPGQSVFSFTSNLYGVFDGESAAAVMPVDVGRALEKGKSGGDHPSHDSALFKAAAYLGKLIAIVKTTPEQSSLEKKLKGWFFDTMPPEFPKMVQQGRPEALIILAYYLVLFKLLPDRWIYQDLPCHDIEIVNETLDPGWEEYMALPNAALQVDDEDALARLLIDCLPEVMSAD